MSPSACTFPSGQQVGILSATFPYVWLFVNANGCVSYNNATGCGIVSAQYSQTNPSSGDKMFLSIHKNTAGNTWCIISVSDPHAYLRIVGCSAYNSNGCGTVNLQYYPSGQNCNGTEAHFITYQGNGLWTIQQSLYANTFLRMDGSECTSPGNGEIGCISTVNGEYFATGTTPQSGSDEVYNIIPL